MKAKLLTALAGAAALAAAGCTSPKGEVDLDVDAVPWVPASAQLASYGGCDEALEGIQNAAVAMMAQWQAGEYFASGFAEDGVAREEGDLSAAGDSAEAPTAAASDSHSQTNNAVAGVDEPDIVKTDGTFVYSVLQGELRAVDTRSGEVVGEHRYDDMSWDHQLFLGDDELLVMYTQDRQDDEAYYSEFTIDRLDPATLEVLDTFSMEGSMVDARMVDGEVRLAVSSQPSIAPVQDVLYDADADLEDLKAAVAATALEDWVPGFTVNGEDGEVDCRDIAHPDRFSGSAVTVFGLSADGGWEGVEPHTVMADGDTVYGTTESLYLAHYDYGWGAAEDDEEPQSETELYRFHFEGGEPRLAGEATVAGSLLNQYSLSEYDGHLRVATTENDAVWGWWGGCGPAADCAWDGAGIAPGEVAPSEPEPSKSTVTVFAVGDEALTETGSVTDLGVTEQIYAVRFIADTAYIVTFRQTDPLYTVDLSDPANPVVTGELKITGYSGYLHPVGADRLLGVGQEATEDGVTTGLQVSLFDTAAPEAAVLDQYFRENSDSAVQWDPHAFLYWDDAGIAVLPVTDWGRDYANYRTGALVLAVGTDTVEQAAWIEQEVDDPYSEGIVRTLVIGDQLWTLSAAGLQSNELGGGYAQTAWIGF
ncbi:beta-propeller domain-containing protein [Glycomyces sp. NPDC047010]|uniref:beta-propeller domain-containing protein n=1 Tax=Glycomyces sp. NPDC047010 TaxID=3155023 RepID=UPI0034117A53